ncbi:MAG TPA: hypothetical protein VNZ58_03640 [Thermomicrobiales bacterium]|nr:hypothetical protein [Thermomicrobiales bacterium]
MARVDIAITTAPGSYAGESVAVMFTAADTSDKNQFALTNRDVVLIHNTGGGAATWTATSVPDSYGREQHIAAESIAAGAVHVFGPIGLNGWQQTDGAFYLEASAATVKFAVIRLP